MAMVNQWLSWLNCLMGILTICLLTWAGIIWLTQPDIAFSSRVACKQSNLPKNAFEQPSESYEQIGEPLLTLQTASPGLQVPDIRQHLVYYGKNGRPDAQTVNLLLHFSFNGSRAIVSIPPQERLYLVYDKQGSPCRYAFSPNNIESSLWIEAMPLDNEVLVKVFLQNDKGEMITDPESHSQFKLPEKEFVRLAGTAWELGKQRVDGTLLARQRARWFGSDRFLERHGGEEYKGIFGKQRVDFGENDEIYSIFVSMGDCFIWDKNCWTPVKPGEDSIKHPLLVSKKVDERLMAFELWDVEGKGKIVLNLLKSTEPWSMHHAQTLQHIFKFIGARTKTQYIFEINRERMLLSPSDWLLLTSKGWKKLAAEEEIDHYVKRKTLGTLFVFEGIIRKEDRQIIQGILYNPSRCDFQVIEIPAQSGGAAKSIHSKEIDKVRQKDNKEDDEEEDEGENSETVPMHPGMRAGKSEMRS